MPFLHRINLPWYINALHLRAPQPVKNI